MTPYGVRKKRQPRLVSLRARNILLISVLLLGIFYTAWHYRKPLAFYFSHKTSHSSEQQKLHALRNFQVLSNHPGMCVGFDVSQYQGEINWKLADSVDNRFPLDFVIIRATAGKDAVDAMFHQNWIQSSKTNLLRGAYHYYRPDENSLEQAQNFIATVKLKKGDLPPVLDIEQVPRNQPMDSLRAGLKRWLKTVGTHYGVKPVIYSGESFYKDYLRDHFDGYPFWIANYNFFVESINSEWMFWQFSEKGTIPGIRGPVDMNIFNGSLDELGRMAKK